MKSLDAFIGATLKGFLIVAGLATCLPIVMAINLELGNRIIFGGQLTYTPVSEPALRHWALMIFLVGVLMIAAAFRPWLTFATMLFSLVEKSALVLLYLANRDQPWGSAYFSIFVIDGIIVLYTLVYFASSQGRPRRWV